MISVNPSSRVGIISQGLSASPPSGTPDTVSPPLLPSPAFASGDPVALLAKLVVKNAQEQRDKESSAADASDKAEDAADARQIDALEEKAKDNLMAGMASGVGQLGQAACSFGAASAGSDAAGKRWEGGGQASMGFGKIGESLFKKGADEADIDATRAGNESKVAKRASDALRKAEDAAAQDTQKIIGILQDIKNAQAQEEHAAVGKM